MSLLSGDKYKLGPAGEPLILKAVQGERKNGGADEHRCKICSTSSDITNLPSECLDVIFKFLETRDDRTSFCLTCRQWLHIHDNNIDSLWYGTDANHPRISPESFSTVLCKLLTRFQHVKYLSLRRLPKITDFVTSNSELCFGLSKIENLCLDKCTKYSNRELSMTFTWFPRLTHISLVSTKINDKGLEVLATCCPSLKTIKLSYCTLISDSGISLLLQKCPDLSALYIDSCSSITGIGFLECPKTLILLKAGGCKLNSEGIKAIVSGGGLEYLSLAVSYKILKVGEGCINTEAVMAISKGCPSLKKLILSHCEEVEIEGWEAIRRNCNSLEDLKVYECRKSSDQEVQALNKTFPKLCG